jgi:hypothetical protein
MFSRIVDEECYPYRSGVTGIPGDCKISRKTYSLADVKECPTANRLSGRTELYKTGPAYRIKSDENDIKYEILTSGPVQGTQYNKKKCECTGSNSFVRNVLSAVMSVSGDFFSYQTGVYQKPSLQPTQRVGYHSVRIIGWGEQFLQGRLVKYWVSLELMLRGIFVRYILFAFVNVCLYVRHVMLFKSRN